MKGEKTNTLAAANPVQVQVMTSLNRINQEAIMEAAKIIEILDERDGVTRKRFEGRVNAKAPNL